MGLLNLVEQHDRVGFAAHALGELSALLITYIARRRTNEARHVEGLGIFAHVHTYQGIGRAKHLFGQFLGEVGLTHTRRTKEHEGADGMVGGFQAHTVALDSLHHLVDGIILGNDARLERGCHILQAHTLVLGHTLHGDAGHHRYHVRDLGLGHRLTFLVIVLCPGSLHLGQLLFQLHLVIAIAGRQFVVLIDHSLVLLVSHLVQLLLDSLDFRRNLRIL